MQHVEICAVRLGNNLVCSGDVIDSLKQTSIVLNGLRTQPIAFPTGQQVIYIIITMQTD
jgi:hypothetical protein